MSNDFTPFTKEQIEAGFELVEETWRDAFKDVPCPCPNCPLTQGNH